MQHTVKAIVAGSLLTGMSLSLAAQTAFVVKGSLKDTTRNGEKAFISYFNGEKEVYTTAPIINGDFTFEGTVIDPAWATVSIPTTKEVRKATPWFTSEKCEFFIEGGMVTIEGLPLDKAVINAPGKAQKDLLAYETKVKPFQEKERASYNSLLRAIIARDSVATKQFRADNDACKQQVDSAELAFMKSHPASHVSLELLRERVTAKALAENKETLSGWYEKLADPLKKTVVGKKLADLIATSFKMSPGQPAADFVLNDTLGNPVHLSSFKGKYVLLDFWASWCIPCRAENKNVIKVYEQYKDKGFTVLGVSLEKPGDRKAWVTAIIKDGLPWTQVAPLTSEENKMVTKLYGIQEIPMNFLIDPQGKIVAVHLRGEDLEKRLSALF